MRHMMTDRFPVHVPHSVIQRGREFGLDWIKELHQRIRIM